MTCIFFYSILILILLSIFVPSIYNYAYKCFIGRIVLILLIIFFSKHSILLGLVFVAVIIITSMPLYEGFSTKSVLAKDMLVTSNTSIKDIKKNQEVFDYFAKYYCEKGSNGNVVGPNKDKLKRWENILSNIKAEPIPSPPCPDGWWQNGNQCLQICALNSQERHPDGTCICNQGGSNQNCNSRFKCVSNRCTRENSSVETDKQSVAFYNKILQQVLCNPDTSQYYQNYGNNFQQSIRMGSAINPGQLDGCTAKAIDEHYYCPYWAAFGECLRNPGYMSYRCKASCNRISGTNSTDTNHVYNIPSCLKGNFNSKLCDDKFIKNFISSSKNVSNNPNLDESLQQDGQWALNMYDQVCSK